MSLSPVGSFFDELAFILWEVEGARLLPIVTGKTARNRLIIDDPDYDGDPAELEAVLRAMISGEPPIVVRRDPAVPNLVRTR